MRTFQPRAGIAVSSSVFFAAALLCLLAGYSERGAFAAPQADASAPEGPLDARQIQALVKRAVELQHKSDEALEEYDRTERVIFSDRDHQQTETVSRAVPTGTGLMHVELVREGKPVPRSEVTQGWKDVAGALESRTHVNDSDVKKDYDRAAKHRVEVAKMVDAMADAFTYQWIGRTMRNGRPTIELSFQPSPEFKSSLRFASVYRQVWGKVWIDEGSGYVVRLEAELRGDIGIAAGIVGKVYSGSHAELEQGEVLPGVWLPTTQSFDIEGRKFVFPASYHHKLFATDYRHMGPPAQALSLIRSEHAQLFTSAK
jgi:hypothetical protein